MTSRWSWAAEGTRKLDRIGMQLYTVREMMKKDFEGTLAKVAAIGYNEVEFAGYFDHAAERYSRDAGQEQADVAQRARVV